MTGDNDQPCVECNPGAFADDKRPKIFLPLCDKHLALVQVPSDEEIEQALEQGRKDCEAVRQAEGSFVPPRGFFR